MDENPSSYVPECPFCGAADVHVVTTPGEGWFAKHGTADCENCGSRFSYQIEDEERLVAELEAAEPAVMRTFRAGPVRYQPVRCPKCRSRRVPVHTTRRMAGMPVIVRYHKCAGCGFNFKSVEEVEEGS